MSDDKWATYSAAEEAVEMAREELEAVADNLVAIAGALRKRPVRLTLDDPNQSVVQPARNEEPTEIDWSRLPNQVEIRKMALHFVECEKNSIKAYAALPEDLRNRLKPNRQ